MKQSQGAQIASQLNSTFKPHSISIAPRKNWVIVTEMYTVQHLSAITNLWKI